MLTAHFAIFVRDVSPELCRELLLLGNVVRQRREKEKNMWELVLTSLALGVGLAMDACAVSMANGLNEPKMSLGKHTLIAGMFGFFQALMPMTGWLCVNTLVEHFGVIKPIIPYVSLALLLYVGIKMLVDGIRKKDDDEETKKLTFVTLLIQAIATSLDALSTGFAMTEFVDGAWQALLCSGIIAAVTFVISFVAVILGRKFGDKLGDKAQILGGIVLIAIGIEIFVKGVFLA